MASDDVLLAGSYVRGEGGGPLVACAVEGEVLRLAPNRVWIRGLPALAIEDFTWTSLHPPGAATRAPSA